MAGAYCRYCGHRCFVYRQVWRHGRLTFSGHLATCTEGKAWDRSQLGGVDADTAYNPADPASATPA